ncbi:MAG: hypothetical protein HY852_25810 [Bradyrhizobium sp.]|uniref:hypothetical protein n=1 Tax=Bradyrhizobium sp. TaxID=376 RepID=UPI0025B852D8|nr:hypothetical protein [Bradyrhizobium sp.]MBI5265224.1 hypothetical protein [Bradyrhizobium sp.]
MDPKTQGRELEKAAKVAKFLPFLSSADLLAKPDSGNQFDRATVFHYGCSPCADLGIGPSRDQALPAPVAAQFRSSQLRRPTCRQVRRSGFILVSPDLIDGECNDTHALAFAPLDYEGHSKSA